MKTDPGDAKWEQVALGDVCEFRRGLTYKKSDEVPFSKNAILRANNITVETGEINFDEIRFINDEIDIPPSKKIIPGCLLVCTASGSKKHLGKIGMVDTDSNYAFGGFMGILVPVERVLPKYLFYVTRSDIYRYFIDALSDGMNINNLKWSQLSQFQISIPPLAEQKRIVAVLDEAFAAIATATANTEKNLANARELFESRLHAAFSIQSSMCAEATVSDLGVHSLGKMLDKKKNRGDLRPYLRNFNVRWFEFDLSSLHKMRFLASEKDQYTVKPGDLLICEGGYPGRAAIWQGPEVIHFQKAVHRVRFHDQNHAKWFLYFLYYMDATEKIQYYFTGAGIQHLTGKALASISIPTPPAKEIAKHVEDLEAIQDKVEELTKTGENKLALLAELKQSLLHQAFTGELTAGSKAADRSLSEAGA